MSLLRNYIICSCLVALLVNYSCFSLNLAISASLSAKSIFSNPNCSFSYFSSSSLRLVCAYRVAMRSSLRDTICLSFSVA
jgi:hypothetical protein